MFENEEQYMENKLLILFTLGKMDIPVTGLGLDEVMLKPGLMNYFSLHLALSELAEAGAINCDPDTGGTPMYSITEKGREILASMDYTIKKGLAATYEACVKSAKDIIKKETEVNANVFVNSAGNYFVRCYIRNGRTCSVDIKIPVADKKEGMLVAENWKTNSAVTFLKVYSSMIPKNGEKE